MKNGNPRASRILLAALVVAFSCGSPDAGEPEAAEETSGSEAAVEAGVGADPCAVVTAEDVVEVTGSEPAPPSRVTPVAGGVSFCDWRAAADTMQTLVTVMAIPAPALSYEQFVEQSRAILEEAFDESLYEPVEGVGTMAVWSEGTLQAWDRGHMVQIQSGVGGPALDREQSAELARRAIGRL